ncbi:calcium-binding protein [Jannaschia sp. M317]|uniref:calcium-binding protein n=1 Tax=Jannaschia sp. M317 TaxID=2867011 RepID=UPI0022019675|nr:calcium-binding protein [Jannaschia sp. M317]UWQ19645.1 hypothetical protein K3551_18285 [Jannaschia sp. M317]
MTLLSNRNFWIPDSLGSEVNHPWIVTYFRKETIRTGDGLYDFTIVTTIQYDGYPYSFDFTGTSEQIRLGNDGNGDLLIHHAGGTTTLRDFEDGRAIRGFAFSDLSPRIPTEEGTITPDYGSSTLTVTEGTTSSLNVLGLPTIEAHYFLEQVSFSNGETWDLTRGVTVRGTAGDDDLMGFDINDHTGRGYADLIQGFAGNDVLQGFGGNDTLDGGTGEDQMYGGAGDDTYILRAGDGGTDRDLGLGILSEQVGEGTDTLRITGIAPDALRIWQDADGFAFGLPGVGGAEIGLQIIETNAPINAGHDFWQRYERVEFDDGTVWTEATGLVMRGTDAGQEQTGTETADRIEGRGGDDLLQGFGGDDTLDGGTGADQMYGGAGDDTYLLRAGDGTPQAYNEDGTGGPGWLSEAQDEGTDTIRIIGVTPDDLRIWFSTDGLVFGLPDGAGGYGLQAIETFDPDNGAMDFWQRYERVEFDDGTVWTEATGLVMRGTDAGQEQTGTETADRIEGRGGDDLLQGFGGNDTLDGGTGADQMYGGAGDDTYLLRAGDGTPQAYNEDGTGGPGWLSEAQDEGTDTIRIIGVTPDDLRIWFSTDGLVFGLPDGAGGYGLQAIETFDPDNGAMDFWQRYERVEFDDGTVWTEATGLVMRGTDAGQEQTGTETADRIEGRGGDDLLQGFGGNDTLDGGTGADQMYGGAGDDTYFVDNTEDYIREQAGGGAQDRVFSSISWSMNQEDRAHLEHLTLIGAGPIDGTGNARANEIIGTPDSNRLSGEAGNDTLRGLDGADTLSGGAGNDLIEGGETEADLRDVIFGGDGDDTIDGGYGNDALRGDAGNDQIAGGFGADTVIGGAGNDTLTGSAFGDEIFGGDGMDFVNGGFGSDRVNGGADADSFFHLGIADHGSDWIQDYNAADGDVLVYGGNATRDQFQINVTTTPTAGADDVAEAFVIYRPTGQILWALVDGDGQDQINLRLGGQVFDLTV